jgi:phosphodiesterase/alkaline phosphatase D-like protein
MLAMQRREFLAASLAAAAKAADWDAGQVVHLLPGANHERILLKASFRQALSAPPQLRIGGRHIAGEKTDGDGLFWRFDAPGLKPSTRYELQLLTARRKPLCDPWPLRTLPHPDDPVSKLRLLIYTCAGGHEEAGSFLKLAIRRKLLANGLAQQPDAVIAIGDHVYWDQHSGVAARATAQTPIGQKVGAFDETIPVLGTPNEAVLKRAVSPQVADLYGTMFRSVPVFFLQDDHDQFDNDEATEHIITFPPADFNVRLARAVQSMYYPEFLPAPGRPLVLPGIGNADRPPGVSESFGTLRWGKLLEIMMYDCRRHLSLRGPLAGFVPPEVEAWLVSRMKAGETAHVVNMPSTPIAWSAGKWGEWYPDVLDAQGRLGTARPKYFWQAGWRSQHDRLVAAASAMPRLPLFISGDLHALAEGRIERNGAQDLRRNPVVSILSGPVSTGPTGWPSSARKTPPLVPTGMEVKAGLSPLEHNGFTILDVTPDAVEGQFFKWKLGEPESGLEAMRPFHRFRHARQV